MMKNSIILFAMVCLWLSVTAQGLEKLDETWYRCLSTPQHAIHIDDEIPDIRWDLTDHGRFLY